MSFENIVVLGLGKVGRLAAKLLHDSGFNVTGYDVKTPREKLPFAVKNTDLTSAQALAAVFAVLTGMVGALSGKYLFEWFGIGTNQPGWMARGFALGTAAHGIGAARALQVDADAGAFAGLALGLQVLLASVLMPIVYQWLRT